MILSDLSTRKRHDLLWLALGFVLQDIEQDKGTAAIAHLLHKRLEFPKSEMPAVMTWLTKVAHLVPEASQTGAIVKAYGRYGRRWIWSPRRAVKAGRAADSMIDTSDW